MERQEEGRLASSDGGPIGVRNVSFTWTDTPSRKASQSENIIPQAAFLLSIDDEITFRPGEINIVVGPTGSGKTSLLMALLGEMHCNLQGADSYVSLPRSRGVAYATQESWVQNDTIKASTQLLF